MKNPQRQNYLDYRIAGILGIIGHFANVQILTDNYTLLLIGFLVLAVVTTLKKFK
jgi:hypothetical protein